MTTWEFPHPETGTLCRAVYDGAVLTVDPVETDPDELGMFEFGDEERLDWEEPTDTIACLDRHHVSRTHCASVDAAIRELRLIGVDRAYLS